MVKKQFKDVILTPEQYKQMKITKSKQKRGKKKRK